VIAHLLERPGERGDIALGELLEEVLLDASVMHGPRAVERVESRGRDEDVDRTSPGAAYAPLPIVEFGGATRSSSSPVMPGARRTVKTISLPSSFAKTRSGL
jgi:hypothetical protein